MAQLSPEAKALVEVLVACEVYLYGQGEGRFGRLLVVRDEVGGLCGRHGTSVTAEMLYDPDGSHRTVKDAATQVRDTAVKELREECGLHGINHRKAKSWFDLVDLLEGGQTAAEFCKRAA